MPEMATKAERQVKRKARRHESVTDVLLAEIRTDGTQSRAEINQAAVEEYAEAMRCGADFPPPVVFFDGSDYWPGDGLHRAQAALLCELTSIGCNVHKGGRREALKYSLSANTEHGLRRTHDDKRRAVEIALSDDEWRVLSDRAIADMCAVSNTFVGKVRGTFEVAQVSSVDTSTARQNPFRRGRDGKMQPATKRKKAHSHCRDHSSKSVNSGNKVALTSEVKSNATPTQLESRKEKALELISQLRLAMEGLDLLEEVDRWLEQMAQLVHGVK